MADQNAEFTMAGGRLCLDFINTEVGRSGHRNDLLGSYQDLVRWARVAGALDGGEADYVMERWSTGPEADAALTAARALRRELRAVAEQLLVGSLRVGPEAFELTNQALRSRPGYLQLERSGPVWAARWKVPLRRPDDVLWRVARSAAALLTDDDPLLVRRCQRQTCGLFFYDTTKNHRKRFCRMDVCGAAERAAAYYRRRTAR
jgi:predicted RNA-binding Zn ribbon-like protein